MKKGLLVVLLGVLSAYIQADPYPVTFCVPECKIVKSIPRKTKDFASLIPGELSTYVFTDEESFYQDYRRSYYALTKKKGGWDCLRHYEILANGCIPYFLDLDKCDSQTMYFLPKELILEAMNIRGVSQGHIDHGIFDRQKYYEILEKLLAYTREHLTTKIMAKYILDTLKYSGSGKILFLSNDPSPDYLRCLILEGFKELLGDRVIDFPKIEHIYTSYGDEKVLYGKGFTYTKLVEDRPVDRENIEERIRNKEFDLVIYGSVHRGMRYHSLVKQVYPEEQIAYMCGEDDHKCQFFNFHNFFLREFR